MPVPDTSTTLLRDVSDSQHARWAVFHSRYEPMMRAYLRERFPALEPDDIIQETFVALARALPNYVYNPAENGYFHNYLTGILRHKALHALDRSNREQQLKARCLAAGGNLLGSPSVDPFRDADLRQWRESIFEIALQQYLADDSVSERTRQVFVHLAVNHENPQDVARAFGMERNAVDQIKRRGLIRLRELVKALEQLDDGRLDD